MVTRNIRLWPDPILAQACAPVDLNEPDFVDGGDGDDVIAQHGNVVSRGQRRFTARTPRLWPSQRHACGQPVDDHVQKAAEARPQRKDPHRNDDLHAQQRQIQSLLQPCVRLSQLLNGAICCAGKHALHFRQRQEAKVGQSQVTVPSAPYRCT